MRKGPERAFFVSKIHTGAIDVFQRSGSLTKFQQVMGHSNMTVSLGYLRNVELPTLQAGDMPTLSAV